MQLYPDDETEFSNSSLSLIFLFDQSKCFFSSFQQQALHHPLLSKKILDYSSSFSSSQMWLPSHNGGRINKFWLIDNLTSSNYQSIKEINYNYHLNGLDLLVTDEIEAKTKIIKEILNA